MNTRNNVAVSSIRLVYIGGVGFMFEVRQDFKHNLISPDVLSFFEGVQETGAVTEVCAFHASIPLTNQRNSIFHNIGEDWAVCSDGIFRKCTIVECEVRPDDTPQIVTFYIDSSLNNKDILGVISKRETK